MTHTIIKEPHRITISLKGIGSDREALLRAFDASGACDHECTDHEAKSVGSIGVRPVDDGVSFELRARENVPITPDDAEACLDTVMERLIAQTGGIRR